MKPSSQRGFTIIEAMITLAILTIAVSLAIPSYLQYVIRSNRSEAIEALLAASACQERLLIRNNAYDADVCGGGTENGFYVVSITTSNDDQNFVATATPQGSQVNDNCGAMTLTDTGIKTAGGETGIFARKCWAGKYADSGS